ncbi:hypothetical protein L286_11810 [Sphingobium sp. HDIP04]|nr:hypothetical protein L286_11810 [Sphingobium sp. HDIP04]
MYACLPKVMPEKLKQIAGADNEVVADLSEKTEAMKAQRQAFRSGRKSRIGMDKPLRIKPAIGTPPAPQFQPLENLKVDDTYQRSIEGGASRTLIVKIAENWDWRLCLPLLVSRRNGELFVIDGQHRLEAASLRGDIPHLPVVIFDFDDPKAEAELFVQANRSRRAMGMLDDFHAAVVAGDKKALEINETVQRAGLAVGRIAAWQYWKPGEVVFVNAIKRALTAQGQEVAVLALSTMAKAFEGLAMVGGSSIFDALCKLIHEANTSGNPLDLDLMQIVLAEVGLPGWQEVTRGVEGGMERAEVMLRALRKSYEEAGAE